MRTSTLICLLFLFALPALARQDESIEQLKGRLESATGDEKIRICLEIADRQVSAADKAFTDGNIDVARTATEDVATFAEKARDLALESGHRLKDTEIAVRKMAHRLEGVKRSLAFEDQPIVDASVKRLEDVRTVLLARMFSKDKKR